MGNPTLKPLPGKSSIVEDEMERLCRRPDGSWDVAAETAHFDRLIAEAKRRREERKKGKS